MTENNLSYHAVAKEDEDHRTKELGESIATGSPSFAPGKTGRIEFSENRVSLNSFFLSATLMQ